MKQQRNWTNEEAYLATIRDLHRASDASLCVFGEHNPMEGDAPLRLLYYVETHSGPLIGLASVVTDRRLFSTRWKFVSERVVELPAPIAPGTDLLGRLAFDRQVWRESPQYASRQSVMIDSGDPWLAIALGDEVRFWGEASIFADNAIGSFVDRFKELFREIDRTSSSF